MSDLRFGIEINARDKTQGGLKSALASVTGFARGAMGALRDFNLGLRPAVAGLDRLIERGAEVEVIRKAFERMTNTSGRGADALAKRLVGASSGTLRLAEAMAIANRALGSGMKFNDVATAIEFIGKKSIATGKDAKGALDTVITGLSRGSTLFLDDFGILVDGVDGVKRSFDAMKGKGAFEALGPAAQKAETIRQAIAEMSGQMGRMGVTGRETIFLFQGMKNAVGDLTDKLVLSIAKSRALKEFLAGTRDLLRGLGEHFDKGGTFGEVFFGKLDKDGKTKIKGLLSVAGAAVMDLGENLGRSILGGLLKALAAGPDIFASIGEGLKNVLIRAAQEFYTWFKAQQIFPALWEGAKKVANELVDVKGAFQAAGRGVMGFKASDAKAGAALKKGNLPAGVLHQEAAFLRGMQGGVEGIDALNPVSNLVRGIKSWFKTGDFNVRRDPGPQAMGPLFRGIGLGGPHAMGGMLPMNPLLAAGVVGAQGAMGVANGGAKKLTGQDQLRQWGDELLGGMGFERTRAAGGSFIDGFGSGDAGRDANARRAGLIRRGNKTLSLTDATKRRIARDIARAEHRLKVVEGGGAFARQAGLRAAGEEIRGLRQAGFRVTPADERRIREESLKEAREGRARPIRDELKELREAQNAGRLPGAIKNAAKDAAAGRADGEKQEKLLDKMELMIQKYDQLFGALMGENKRIAAAK